MRSNDQGVGFVKLIQYLFSTSYVHLEYLFNTCSIPCSKPRICTWNFSGAHMRQWLRLSTKCEDYFFNSKRIMWPEMRPISFGTFEKQDSFIQRVAQIALPTGKDTIFRRTELMFGNNYLLDSTIQPFNNWGQLWQVVSTLIYLRALALKQLKTNEVRTKGHLSCR